jgi:uncharacterized 2Fe-2S/4Fe-4S cluster protein (DUF4445 family)
MLFEGHMQISGAVKMPPAQFTVKFANLGREVEAHAGETLLQCGRRTGVRIVGACGGRGACGSCTVRIISGSVDYLQAANDDPTQSVQGKEWVRACLVRPLSDCVVEVAPRALATVARTDVEGRDGGATVPFEPLVRTYDVELAPPVMGEGNSDLERVYAALTEGAAERIDLAALQSLPRLLRENGWRLRASVRQGEVIGFTLPGRRTLGLAVDLGTTNVAASLTDMESGARLATLGIENPQAVYGADLISRINHAIRTPSGSSELQTTIVTAIAALARDLCESVAAQPDEIVDITVCGNTAMHHLMLGLPVSQLGRAPFVPAACAQLDVKARDLGLAVLAGAYVHILPNIGGFVGGDHVAALLATEEGWAETTSIVIDIGTNTEISLIHRGEITTASTASGPALEGGNISAGMRAAEGAVERVWLHEGEIRTQVIGDAAPVGLCGSGVLEALATLYHAGIIDRSGRMRAGHPHVRDNGKRRECTLAPNVPFTQGDVRAVQLAKAAIRTGVDLLLREAGLTEQSLERVIIAGAFGAYIDVTSAIAIGMLPPLPAELFEQVGNAAGVGVRMTLVSGAAREHARHLAARCRHVELSTLAGFQKVFLSRIGL